MDVFSFQIGVIESDRFLGFPGWEKSIDHSSSDLMPRLRRYYQIWEHLAPLLRTDRVFIFATAKQPGFLLIGQKLLPDLRPPSNLANIVLGRLSAKHVEEA